MANSNVQTSARWTVNTTNISTVVGASASGTYELTISNIVNGVYSGYDLSAKDFKIGGATGPVSVGSGFKWTGGNVDSEVQHVVFTDNGTAGDPTNTIKVEVTLNSTSITTSNANQNIYIDIDEIPSDGTDEPPPEATRRACLKSVYPNPYGSNHTVSITDITSPNITETSLGNSSATPGGVGWSNLNVTQHTGVVSEGVANKIAELSFTAADQYYYAGGGNGNSPAFVGFQNLSQAQNTYADYTSAYSYNVFDIVLDSFGTIKSWKIEVLYTPPTSGTAAQDPGEGMCPLDHKIFIEYMLNGYGSATPQGMVPLTGDDTGGIINKVIHTKDIRVTGGDKKIEVRGTPGAKYSIKVTKTAGHDSSTVVDSNGYYNFDAESWQNGDVSFVRTIPSDGCDKPRVNIPFSSSNARYDVIIGSNNGSTLAAGVPTSAGQAKMLQYGNATFTLGVTTSTASNFGTLPSSITITKPSSKGIANKNFYDYGVGYNKNKIRTIGSTKIRGQSRGVSSTRLIIDDKRLIDRIKPGMKIRSSTGDIAQGTTVVSVDRKSNKIELSSAHALNVSNLTFEPVYGGKNFEFIITPGASGDIAKTLNVNTSNSLYDAVNKKLGVPQSLTKTVDGAVTSSTTVKLDDIEHIVPGLSLQVGDVVKNITAVSTDNLSQVTLDSAISLSDNASVIITGGAGSVYVESAQVVKVGNNIHIRGCLKCKSLESSITVSINIDNLINVS